MIILTYNTAKHLIMENGLSSPIVADKTAKHNEGIESSEMIAPMFKPEIKH